MTPSGGEHSVEKSATQEPRDSELERFGQLWPACHVCPMEDIDDCKVDMELFRRDGWTKATLIKHLGWHHAGLMNALRQTGLKLDARKKHSLNDRDVETILTLFLKRRAERLYGGAQRARQRP